MFNLTNKASEQQSRDVKLVELAVNLNNLIKSQEKVDQDIEKMTDKFSTFSENVTKQLNDIANDLKSETTSLKRDLKDFESQKEEIEKLKGVVEEYSTYWKKYKNDCINNQQTFLGIRMEIYKYIAIGFVMFIFVEAADYIRNPKGSTNQSTIEKTN